MAFTLTMTFVFSSVFLIVAGSTEASVADQSPLRRQGSGTKFAANVADSALSNGVNLMQSSVLKDAPHQKGGHHGDGETGNAQVQDGTLPTENSTTVDEPMNLSSLMNSSTPFDPVAGVDELSYVISSEPVVDEKKHKQHHFHVNMVVVVLGTLLVLGTVTVTVVDPSAVAYAFTELWGLLPAIVACLAFMIVGPALITLNKEILQKLQFSYPLTLSGLGLFFSAVFSHLLVRCGVATVRSESMDIVRGSNMLKVALPIGACKALTLAAGNAAYLYLGLSFIQMLKALTPVFVLVAMRAVGVSSPSQKAMGCVLIIVFGTLLEVKGEMHATMTGLFLMFLSEFCEAVNLVLTQLCLQDKRLTVIEGLYALTPFGSFCIFTLAAVLEWPTLLKQGGLQIVAAHPSHFLWAGTLGFLVNFLSFLVVQHTSSLTCKILNTVRSIALVMIGLMYYGEESTFMELLGYAIAFAGFCGYCYVQATESAANERKALCKNVAGQTLDSARVTYSK